MGIITLNSEKTKIYKRFIKKHLEIKAKASMQPNLARWTWSDKLFGGHHVFLQDTVTMTNENQFQTEHLMWLNFSALFTGQ